MNIVNGDSAAGAFRQAYHLPREAILVFRDVLSCGELRQYTEMEQWGNYRTRYWSSLMEEHGFGAISEDDKMPRDLYQHLDELKAEEEIHLWLGCALSDQLLLVFVVMLFNRYGLNFEKLYIHQYQKNCKDLIVVGVALLNPDDIKALAPQPYTLNSDEIKYCLTAWEAVTSSTPGMLLELLADKAPAMPLLCKALKNFIYRYPDIARSLSRFDEIILKHVHEHAPNAARIIGYTLAHDMRPGQSGDCHALDMVGDIYLFSRLKRLAKLSEPLISLNVVNASMRETSVNITEFGSDVLAGRRNTVEVNGIDDWVGGVCLRENNRWFRDDEMVVSI